MITKPEKRNLRVVLTTSEKVDFGRKMSLLHQEYRFTEIDQKREADRFKETLERIDGRMSYIAGVIRAGEETREVECIWRYLFESNSKELTRLDTGEIVETKAIESAERQLMLQIEQEKEVHAAARE